MKPGNIYNSEVPDLVTEALRQVCPEVTEVELLPCHQRNDGSFAPMGGLEEAIVRRKNGDLRPLIIYGFDDHKRILKCRGGSILKARGVFYLQLPRPLSDIRSIFRKAAKTRISEKTAIDVKNAVREIRAFKHRFDNVCLSLQGNAARAEKALIASPKKMPSALKEFKRTRLEEFAREYDALDSLAKRLGIKGAEQVSEKMMEAIRLTERIPNNKETPENAVRLAVECVGHLRAIAQILSAAKDLDKNE
jgi:hypothetical protein